MRLGQVEQHLQQPVQVGRRIKVAPARDMRDALPRIVDNDGQMIAGGHVLADDHGIAPSLGVRLDSLPRAIPVELDKRQRRAAQLFSPPVSALLPCRYAARTRPPLASPRSPRRAPLPQPGIERRTVGIGRASVTAASISARVAKHG